MKAEWFQKLVTEKWAKLSEADALYKVTQQVADEFSLLENDLSENAGNINSGMMVVDYVNKRIEFLDSLPNATYVRKFWSRLKISRNMQNNIGVFVWAKNCLIIFRARWVICLEM